MIFFFFPHQRIRIQNCEVFIGKSGKNPGIYSETLNPCILDF